MSDGLKSIVVKFVGDTLGLEAACEGASKALEKVGAVGEKSASTWDKVSKSAGVLGLALVGGLAAGLKVGIENMDALDDANVALTTTLKNMPNSFGITTAALDAQAEALQAHTTFTRDDILAADNLILKNSALQRMMAAGSLTTKQASTDVLNLATVMGEDASAAAAQYAKILSNPFSATKLLTQAGVVLTTSQTAQIAAWKKSGDTAKAQALILGLLEAKTKGAAAAAGDTLPAKLKQAKEAFSDAAGKLTESLIPALDTVVGWMTKVSTWASTNPGQLRVVVGVVAGLAGTLLLVSAATKIWTGVLAIAKVATVAWNVVVGIATVAQTLWNVTMFEAEIPILVVIAAIALLALGIYELIKHWSDVEAAAKTAWNAIKSAVSTAVNAVVGFFEALPGRIVSALGDVGSLLLGIGADLMHGLENGITGAVGSVLSTVASIPGKALGLLKSGFGIFSPSKKTKETGLQLMQGLQQGIQTGYPLVSAALQTTIDSMSTTFTAGTKSIVTKGESALNSLNLKLNDPVKGIVTKIQTATDALTGLQSASDSLSSSVASSYTGSVDASSFGGQSSASIVSSLGAAVATGADFSSTIKRLQALGLNSTAIGQLLAAGPQQADAAADALASGGAGLVQQVNQSYSALAAQGTDLGASAAQAMYGAGIQAAQGLIKGLDSQQAALEKQMAKLSSGIVAAVKKALGIKSPSRVFADEVGKHIVTGLAAGVTENAHVAHAAVGSLGGALVGSLGSSGYRVGGGSSSTQVFSGGQDITQFVTKIVTKNTRATRNAVVAGATRAFV